MSLTLSDTQVARMLRQYKSHVTVAAGTHMIRIGRDLCDVFTGTGWTTRSRYRLTNGRWIHITGLKLAAPLTALLPRVG